MLGLLRRIVLAALLLGGLALQPGVASAMTVDTAPAAIAQSVGSAPIQQAYWHHWGWHRHWGYRRHWGWHRHYIWHPHYYWHHYYGWHPHHFWHPWIW